LYFWFDECIVVDVELCWCVCVDMYCCFGFYLIEMSEYFFEYVLWYLYDECEVEWLCIFVGVYVGISEENVVEYEESCCVLVVGEILFLEISVIEYVL